MQVNVFAVEIQMANILLLMPTWQWTKNQYSFIERWVESMCNSKVYEMYQGGVKEYKYHQYHHPSPKYI